MVSWKESGGLVLNSCELTSAPVMIGPFIDDDEEEEHDIAPILKLIDFGSGSLATERSGG